MWRIPFCPSIKRASFLSHSLDEEDEVKVVKKALIAHLDLDPKVTLGVLCDQLTPPEDNMEEDDAFLRDRLRSLVVYFLTDEAKRSIVRHATPKSEVEAVFINGLLTVSFSYLVIESFRHLTSQ